MPQAIEAISETQREAANRIRIQWRNGEVPIEPREFANQFEAWDHSLLLSVVYDAYCLQREHGSPVDDGEVISQFPELGESLHRLLSVDQVLREGHNATSDQDWPQEGDEVADFVLSTELGRGAFSRVWLANEETLDRHVVVKLLPTSAIRQIGEAETLAQLTHPHIVPVNSVKDDPLSGFTAICMPFLGRATLQDVVRGLFAAGRSPQNGSEILDLVSQVNSAITTGSTSERPHLLMSSGTYVDAALWLGSQICEAVAFAHSKRVIHGDIKPANVLLDSNGYPFLFDFNLSREEGSTADLGGTLPYMPPEHLYLLCDESDEPHHATASAEVYSLGVTLYELVSGRLPFTVEPGDRDPVSRLIAQQQRGPWPLVEMGVDRNVAAVIESCLAFDPSSRPDSAAALATDLQRLVQTSSRVTKWGRRHPRLVLSIAAGITVALLSLSAWLTFRAPLHERLTANAQQLFIEGRTDESLEFINRALASNPGYQPARRLRSQIACQQAQHALAKGDLHLAIRFANEALVDVPGAADASAIRLDAVFQQAANSLEDGDARDAAERIRIVIQAEPENLAARELEGRAHLKIARELQAAGDPSASQWFDSSLKSFVQASQNNPTPELYAYRAFCHLHLRQHVNAILYYRKATEAGLLSAAAFNNLGRSLLKQQRYGEAIDALTTAIELNSEMQMAYLNRALAGLGSVFFEKAAVPSLATTDIEQAIEIGPLSRELMRSAVRIWSRTQPVNEQALLRTCQKAAACGINPKEIEELFSQNALRDAVDDMDKMRQRIRGVAASVTAKRDILEQTNRIADPF